MGEILEGERKGHGLRHRPQLQPPPGEGKREQEFVGTEYERLQGGFTSWGVGQYVDRDQSVGCSIIQEAGLEKARREEEDGEEIGKGEEVDH